MNPGLPGTPHQDDGLREAARANARLRARRDLRQGAGCGVLDHEAVEGLVRCEKAGDEALTVEYLVTGSVLEASDVDVDSGSGSRHGGDVVVTVNGSLIQAQLDGWVGS